MKVRIKNNLEGLSSYDKQMEDFVKTKKNRVIEVFPIEIQGTTFYKCNELDYWYFTEFMIEEIVKETNSEKEINKKINEYNEKIKECDILIENYENENRIYRKRSDIETFYFFNYEDKTNLKIQLTKKQCYIQFIVNLEEILDSI